MIVAAISATTCCHRAQTHDTERAKNDWQHSAAAIAPFNFREMKFRPLLRILSPPGNAFIVFEDQFIAFNVLVILIPVVFFVVTCSFFCDAIDGFAVGILHEEVGDDDRLTILQNYDEIIAIALEALNTFRRQLHQKDRSAIRRKGSYIFDGFHRTRVLIDDDDIFHVEPLSQERIAI